MRYHGERPWHREFFQGMRRWTGEDWKWVCATVASFPLFIETPSLQSNVLSRQDQLATGMQLLICQTCHWFRLWIPKMVSFGGHVLAAWALRRERDFFKEVLPRFRLAYSEATGGFKVTTCGLQVVAVSEQRMQKKIKLVTPLSIRTHNAQPV